MTEKQRAASRANSLKSTGPKSEAGKARSRMNAFKTGIDATSAILPNENPADYHATLCKWHTYYRPTSPAAQVLVDRLAGAEWLGRRYFLLETRIQAQAIAKNQNSVDPNFPDAFGFQNKSSEIARIAARVNAIDRNFNKDLDQLTFLLANPEVDLPPDALLQETPAVVEPQPVPATAPEPTPQIAGQTADSTPDNPFPASFLKNPGHAPEAVPQSPQSPAAPTPETGPNPEPQPADSIPDNPSPASFLKNSEPAPKPPARANQTTRQHPSHFRDCPECNVRGYNLPGCPYRLDAPLDPDQTDEPGRVPRRA